MFSTRPVEYLFGPSVYVVCFAPPLNSNDLLHTYNLQEQERRSTQNQLQVRLLKSLNKVTLGYFLKKVDAESVTNDGAEKTDADTIKSLLKKVKKYGIHYDTVHY